MCQFKLVNKLLPNLFNIFKMKIIFVFHMRKVKFKSPYRLFSPMYRNKHLLVKGTVFLNRYYVHTSLLDINFCANNNCSKVFILKKSKIHIRRHFPRIDMEWRPLAQVCLWLHVSSCLHSTRRRYIVSINMASIKA